MSSSAQILPMVSSSNGAGKSGAFGELDGSGAADSEQFHQLGATGEPDGHGPGLYVILWCVQ